MYVFMVQIKVSLQNRDLCNLKPKGPGLWRPNEARALLESYKFHSSSFLTFLDHRHISVPLAAVTTSIMKM